jgi:hypothetical protein
MGGRILCSFPLIEACRQYVSILNKYRSNGDFLRTKCLMGHVQSHSQEMTITGLIPNFHGPVNKLYMGRSGLNKNSFSEKQKKW